MAFSLTSPVTGQAQTGLTSPTYTVGVDVAPDWNAKQWAVSALGGTQTGVRVHSASDPFTITVFRPKTFSQLGKPNPVTGVVKFVPMNQWRILVRKGVLPLAGQAVVPAFIDMKMSVPAGSDTADAVNLRAMLSAAFGAAVQQSAGMGDSLVTGTL
jgi:hypothetical protein